MEYEKKKNRDVHKFKQCFYIRTKSGWFLYVFQKFDVIYILVIKGNNNFLLKIISKIGIRLESPGIEGCLYGGGY